MKRLEGKAAEAIDVLGGIGIVHALAGAVRLGVTDSRPHEDFAFAVRAGPDPVRLTVRAAWPHLVRSRGGVLTAGPVGSLTSRHTAHPASQGAVIALTRRLAAEGAAHGIRAGRVGPGTIGTDGSRAGLLADDHLMHGIARHVPRGRLGVPGDVVDAALFLVFDEATHVTGADPVVDGTAPGVLPGASV